MNDTNILLRHGYIAIPACDKQIGQEALATVLMNLSYYGFALNQKAYAQLSRLGAEELATWWVGIETELKLITGESRKIGNFVVYKNFPAEVLSKTEAEYWIPQILMYWGFPNEFFTEPVKPRPKMNEQKRATVLKLSVDNTLHDIFNSYLKAPARWKEEEWADIAFILYRFPIQVGSFVFKENLVRTAIQCMEIGRSLDVTNATDVLRLAAGFSNGDISLREKIKFISFKKPIRKYLLGLLEGCNNLAEDMARRPELWKRLIHQLHPGDYKRRFPLVNEVMDDLYKDRLVTFNSQVEELLLEKNPQVLALLSQRPGDFRRRLVHTLDLFSDATVEAFTKPEVLDKLTTMQIVSLRAFLETVNSRQHRTFPPKGNWGKLQLGEPRPIKGEHRRAISQALGQVLAVRLPKIRQLDLETDLIKLPNNGEVGPFTRGTSFNIPDEVEFIRTASYWQNKGTNVNTWFDNGWNFFSADWKDLGACCWNAVNFQNGGAIFSGDPTNSKEMDGKAAQMIDLYPQRLLDKGVRYAVWNILCFSHIPFSKADDVFAALQWGKDAQKGKLFEPSRCQLAFPLTGEQMTKYVCLLDLKTREMIYLDANLAGNVSSAASNGKILAETMPAFMEYIRALPSVYDLFRESVDEKGSDIHVLYSDKDVELNGESAYVFRSENKNNNFKPIDLNALLA